jgi:hypothetical protein
MKRDVTVVVSGVRQAGALVDTHPLTLTTNADGNQEGSDTIDVDEPVSLVVSMADQPGAKFTIELTIDKIGTVTKKGTLKDDFARRSFDIPFADFE